MQFVNKHVHQMSKLGVALREHGPRGHAASTSPVLAQSPAGFQPGAASGGPTDSWTPICSSDGKHHRPGVSARPARRGARMRAAEEADGTSPVAQGRNPMLLQGPPGAPRQGAKTPQAVWPIANENNHKDG